MTKYKIKEFIVDLPDDLHTEVNQPIHELSYDFFIGNHKCQFILKLESILEEMKPESTTTTGIIQTTIEK